MDKNTSRKNSNSDTTNFYLIFRNIIKLIMTFYSYY